MIKDIAHHFKLLLEEFNGQDKIITTLAGMTRVFEYKGQDNEVRKLPVPIDCEIETDCDNCEGLKQLVPDKSKRCIVYFEGGNSQPLQTLEGATSYQSKISLVCWYNLQGFQDSNLLQSKLIGLFSDKIKEGYGSFNGSGIIQSKSIDIANIIESEASIFSKYTYSQENSQFLGCTFNCFRIDFNVKFLLYENQNCVDSIMVIDIPNCL